MTRLRILLIAAVFVFAVGTLWFLGVIRLTRGVPQTGPSGSVVRITVNPQNAYIERSESRQHLNCDFLLENLTDDDLFLTGVELSVIGDGEQVVRRDFINRFSRKSLEIPADRVLRPKETVLIYNPFHSFAASVPLEKLRFEFAFVTDDGRIRHASVAEVAPVFYETKTSLILPVKGRVLVWDGHDYQSHHRRTDYSLPGFRSRGWSSNFQRYGYDLVIVNEQGVMYRGGPKHSEDWYEGRPGDNEEYFAFGQPVYAAGAGRVADTHDGEEDNRRVDAQDYRERETAGGGNYVVIDHLNGEFSWFGHLKKGSIRVTTGQSVQQGEVIGEMGASGESIFPHLHYELRTGPGIKGVEGLPSYFDGFFRMGSQTPVTRGQLDTGDIVDNR